MAEGFSRAFELSTDGLSDEKLIRKACGRANQVIVYTDGGRTADMWFAQNSSQSVCRLYPELYKCDIPLIRKQ